MDTSTSKQPRRSLDPLIGCLLNDRYLIERRIGKGGMGIVYLAEHVRLRRKVALKTLNERAFASEELVARFQREAMAAAAIGNEHVVGVTDMGQLDDGSFFVVLEYLDGVELAHAVEEQGAFSVARAVHIVDQLCVALSAVHEAGIVHRDLKPENLFLVERAGERDFVKVLDFGVCKIQDDWQSGERPLTRTGQSIGTPQYMAPEQIENSAKVDARADIYAAGAILYYILTGQAPYDDSTLPRLLMRICSEPPPSLRMTRPGMPGALERVIGRAMQRQPEDRYQNAGELRAALQPFLSHAPGQDARPGPDALVAVHPEVTSPSSAGCESMATATPSVSELALGARLRTRRAYATVVCAALLASLVLMLAATSSWRTTADQARAKKLPASRTSAEAHERTGRKPSSANGGLDLRIPQLAPSRTAIVAQSASDSIAATVAEPRARPEESAPSSRGRGTRRLRPALPTAAGKAQGLPGPEDGTQSAGADVVGVPASRPAPITAPNPERSYRLSQRELKDVFP